MKPILRNNNDFSTYQNSSIDFVLNRKLNKGWYVQHLFRHWFIPDGKRRSFLWFDLGYFINIEALRISTKSYIRLHWALDTKGQKLNDFIRFKHSIMPLLNSNFLPFIAVEFWLQLNDIQSFRRYRVESGFNWAILESYSLSLAFRRQGDNNSSPDIKVNHYLSTLTYSF